MPRRVIPSYVLDALAAYADVEIECSTLEGQIAAKYAQMEQLHAEIKELKKQCKSSVECFEPLRLVLERFTAEAKRG